MQKFTLGSLLTYQLSCKHLHLNPTHKAAMFAEISGKKAVQFLPPLLH